MCDRHDCGTQGSEVIKQADASRDELTLQALMGQADGQPDITALIEQARERRQSLQQTVRDMQDSIDTLRIMTKYMLFDLEATRRENAALRRELEGDSPLYRGPDEQCNCEQCEDPRVDQNHDWDGFGDEKVNDDNPNGETPA